MHHKYCLVIFRESLLSLLSNVSFFLSFFQTALRTSASIHGALLVDFISILRTIVNSRDQNCLCISFSLYMFITTQCVPNETITLSTSHIFYSWHYRTKHWQVLNYCLLSAKYHIFCTSLCGDVLDFQISYCSSRENLKS